MFQQLVAVGAIPTLVNLAIHDPIQAVRKKAILALSSSIRNYQPGLDAALKYLPEEYQSDSPRDANNMDEVDVVVQKLRDESQRRG